MTDDSAFSDSKDWTWVLDTRCPECGFVAAEVVTTEIADALRANAESWAQMLARTGDEHLRQRPDPTTWSPLEYACHVRDVFQLYHERLELMLTEDGPHYPNWDQDSTAIEKDYRSADSGQVAEDLTAWAERLAERFDSVSGAQWERTGHRSDGAQFTIDSFGRYLLHDPVHHLWDVRHAR